MKLLDLVDEIYPENLDQEKYEVFVEINDETGTTQVAPKAARWDHQEKRVIVEVDFGEG